MFGFDQNPSSTDCQQNFVPPKQVTSHKSIFYANHFKKQRNSSKIDQQYEGQMGQIKYQISLYWNEDFLLRSKIKGQMKSQNTLNIQQAKSAIIEDIKNKGYHLKKGFKMLLKLKKHTEIILKTDLQKQKLFKVGECSYQGTIIQSKINLPQGYTFLPLKFQGFVVQRLSIANQYGSITWNTSVNVTNIDFSQGIQIGKDYIECSHPQLQNNVLVEFYQLSDTIHKYFKENGSQKGQKKLKKMVNNRKENSCRFIYLDKTNQHWFLEINLNKNDL